MLSYGVRLGVGWCVRLPEGLVSLCIPLYPFLSPFVGWCVHLPEGLVSLCLPLCPFFPLCWMVCPPSRGLVSPCLPWCPFLCPSDGWRVRLPEGLVSLCLSFYPSCFPLLDGVSAFPSFVSHSAPSCFLLLDGVSAFPRVLSPFVSHSTPSCFPLLDGVSAFLTVLSPFVSPCPPSCFPLLDGVSAFPRVLFPCVSHCTRFFFPNSVLLGVLNAFLRCPPSAFPRSSRPLSPFLFPFVGWCARLPEVLSPLVSPFCWMVCPPSRGLVSPLVSFCWMVRLLVSFCWMACPPSRSLVSLCLPSCFPLLDGVSAFPRSCLPLPPLVSHCFSSCFLLLDGVSALPRSCLLLSFLLFDGVSALPRSCLPLSPIVSLPVICWMAVRLAEVSPFLVPFVGWCVCLPEVLSPFVSPCLPLFLFLLAFVGWCVRLLQVLSPLVSLLVSFCWMGSPPFRGLVSPCLPICVPVLDGASAFSRSLPSPCFPFSPHMCACVEWCVLLPEVLSPLFLIVCPHVCLFWMMRVLSPLVFHCLPTCVPVLDCVSAFLYKVLSPLVSPCLPLFPLGSHCLPSCFLSVDGVSAFPRSCLPLSSIVSSHVSLCWMVRPPSRSLISPCLPACVPVLGGASAFPRSCFSMFPIVSHCLPTCELVLDGASASRGLISPCPIVSPHVCLCWMVCPPSQGLVSSCLVSALPRSCLPSSPMVCPLSRMVSLLVFIFWMVCPPSRGVVSPCLALSPLVSHCLPSCFLSLDGASAFLRSHLPCSPIVSPHVCLCWMVCPPSRGLVSPCLLVSPLVSLASRASHFLSSLVSHCLPHKCKCVGWCVRFAEVSPLVSYVSHCLPACACVGPLFPIVNCLPTRAPVLDGVSAFSRSCLRLSPIVSLLFSHLVSPCLPLSPIVSHCLPLSPLVSHCFPLSPHMCACVEWCVLLPEVLSLIVSLPLSSHMCACVGWYLRLGWCVRLLSHCVPMSQCLPLSLIVSPTCVPVLDGVPAFPRSCLSCLSCLPACLSSCFPLWRVVSVCFSTNCVLSGVLNVFLRSALVLDGVSAFPRSCLPSWLPNSVLLGVLNAFSCAWACSSKHFLNPPAVWGLRGCNFDFWTSKVKRGFII